MSDQTKFWIQTLIIPAVLAAVGYFINNTLHEQQRAFEKIKFADQVINEAFDSDNPDKALALTKIIPSLIDDKEFAESLVVLINNYYIKKAQMALKSSNEEEYKQISDAAAVFDGSGVTIAESLKTNPETSKAEKAHNLEQKGLVELQKGDLEAAQKSFQQATKTYPAFKSSNEISQILEKKIEDVKQGADEVKVQNQVLDTIQKNYAEKLNPRSYRLKAKTP